MLKFVYALVSSEKDCYTEQALVSMHSLRRHNPTCHITLATDDDTLESLVGGRARIKEYVNELVVVAVPAEFSAKQRSRFVKTSLRRNVRGDFLYIDCDTVVTGSLAGLESVDCEVAAVYARHFNFRESGEMHPVLEDYYRKRPVTEEEMYDVRDFFNGGIILCKDTEKGCRLFDTWHKFWLESSTKYGYHYDQSDLWRANASLGDVVEALDGVYNCQTINIKYAAGYIPQCKIFHYFSSSSRCFLWLNDPEVVSDIRNNGITPEVEQRLAHLISDTLNSYEVIQDEELRIYNSPLVRLARKVSKKIPFINKFIYLFTGWR